MKALKFISKYLAIGALICIGFLVVQVIYWENYGEEQTEAIHATFSESFQTMIDRVLVDEAAFMKHRKEYNPDAELNLSVQGYSWLGDSVLFTGFVSNLGNNIWVGAEFEFEAFDADDNIFAECSEFLRNIEPGGFEPMIVECPVVNGYQTTPPTKVSFKVKRALRGKTVVSQRN